MDAAIRWLRISYWTGAIADAAVAVVMLSPKLYARGLGLAGFAPGDDFRHAMGMGAALMLGWTVLLLWADRKPLERRGILPLTVAVIFCLAANELRSALVGFLPLARVAPIWILQAVLVALFLGSYFIAGGAERRKAESGGRPPRYPGYASG